MLFDRKQLKIIDLDLTADGVIISYSNGISALYHTNFLFEARLQDGNVPLTSEQPTERKPPTGGR